MTANNNLQQALGKPGAILFFGRESNRKTTYLPAIQTTCKEVRRYIRRSIPDAESEAWLALLQAIHSFNSDLGVPLAGYLESRVKYGLLNLWRKEIKRKRMENQGEKALGYVAAADDPQAELIYKETIEKNAGGAASITFPATACINSRFCLRL